MSRRFGLTLCSAGYILASVNVLAATGLEGWETAVRKANDFIAQLNLTEKVGLTTGNIQGPCTGNIDAIPRLNFSGLCLQDGPLGLRQADLVSEFPAGISTGASWDKELIYTRANYIGQEYRGKGTHIMLGPVAGPLGRHPLGGRNWEGFAADPYLSGVANELSIQGIQDAGVQACVKHFVGNEQETHRSNEVINGVDVAALSSNIDDRTLHEVYVWPFANAVRAGAASVMCSYNRLDSTYACENSRILNEILKDELGFPGYVMSDWFATHSGVPSVKGGLDMTMPGPTNQSVITDIGLGGDLENIPSYFGASLVAAVQNGTVNESRVDDMARRIMAPYFYLRQDQPDFPTYDESSKFVVYLAYGQINNTIGTPPARDVRANGTHAALIRTLGAAGTVLLKNVNGTLPLKNVANVGVFGSSAPDVTGGLYNFFSEVSPSARPFGTVSTGGGSGTGRAVDIISPLQAIRDRGYKDGFRVQWITDNTRLLPQTSSFQASAMGDIYPTPDVCLVFVSTYALEGADRTSFEVDSNGTAVVGEVTKYCPNTVVITHSAGVNTLPFADNKNVKAILAAHYPGEQIGNAIVDVLWGDVNPSGRLPYTIPKTESDYDVPVFDLTGTPNATDPAAWQVDFDDRLLVDYRRFDALNITPLYEFGFGLSYTTFDLASSLKVSSLNTTALSALPETSANATATTPPGGNPALWEPLVNVTAEVTNTGAVAGATVPQLYVSLSGAPEGTPLRALRGFEKVHLQPGESAPVSFTLLRRDLSFWNADVQAWQLPAGNVVFNVGFSSRDFRAAAELLLL